jgi:crossover junction endodeoxyribonuclease RuvC
MFEDLTMGADPGTAAVGLAVVANSGGRPTVRWSGTLRTPARMAAAERLRLIHSWVSKAIAEHRPSALALERLMWGRNTGSAMEVARASGAVMVAAAQAGVHVEEYVPLEVKMAVTGVGNAPKQAVRRSLARVFGMEDVPVEPNAADAVAVAVCHLQQSRLRRAADAAVGRVSG